MKALETSCSVASKEERGAMSFILAHALPATEQVKLPPEPTRGYIKILGNHSFCVAMATALLCIACFSDLDNSNNNSNKHPKKRKVDTTALDERVAKRYYGLLTWMTGLMRADQGFPARLAEWEMESRGSSKATISSPELAESKHGRGPLSNDDQSWQSFNDEDELGLFSINPLGLNVFDGEADDSETA